MKRLIFMLLAAVIMAVVFSLAKNTMAKAALEKGIAAATGLEVRARSVHLSLLKSAAEARGLVVYNPEGFEDAVMINAPLVYADFGLMDYLKRRKLHFQNVGLHLEEFNVIKNTRGRLNLDSVSALSRDMQKRQPGSDSAQKTKPAAELQIDQLRLKIGRVRYRDYTQSPVSEQELALNIDERYENITDVQRLIRLIVARAVVNTAISRLVNLDFSATDIFKGSGLPSEKIEKAADELKKLLDFLPKE